MEVLLEKQPLWAGVSPPRLARGHCSAQRPGRMTRGLSLPLDCSLTGGPPGSWWGWPVSSTYVRWVVEAWQGKEGVLGRPGQLPPALHGPLRDPLWDPSVSSKLPKWCCEVKRAGEEQCVSDASNW